MARDLMQLMRRLFLPAADAVQEAYWRHSIDIYRTPEAAWSSSTFDNFSLRFRRVLCG